MTVKVRFSRAGRKKVPFYHIVAADNRTARNGKCIEKLGYYNPFAKEGDNGLYWDKDRLAHWFKVGAQPTQPLMKLLLKDASLGSEKQRKAWQKVLDTRRAAVEKRLTAEKAAKAAEAKASEAEATPHVEEAKTEEAPVETAPAEKPAKESDKAAAETTA